MNQNETKLSKRFLGLMRRPKPADKSGHKIGIHLEGSATSFTVVLPWPIMMSRWECLYLALSILGPWSEHIFANASAVPAPAKFGGPSKTFACDVQLFHQFIEQKAADAMERLVEQEHTHVYTELCTVTLTQVIIFNRPCWSVKDVNQGF